MQSVKHLYIRYLSWKRKCRKLVRKLEKKRVIQQAQNKTKWLTSKVMMALLKLLKTIDVGARKQAREREAKQRQKHDQVG